MADTLFAEQATDLLGNVDGNRTHQHRLPFCMSRLDFLNYRMIFLFLGLIYRIVEIHTYHRTVRGNLHHIHSVNITELLFFRQCRTCHTALLIVFVKEILERNSSKCLTLSLNFNMFLSFNCLMQSIRISTTWHNSSCEFIYN